MSARQSVAVTKTLSEASVDVAGGGGGVVTDTGNNSVGLIVGVVFGILFLLVGLLIFFAYLRRRQSTDDYVNEYETEVETSASHMSDPESETMTLEDDFDNPLSAIGVSSGDSGYVFMMATEEGVF
jgi:hypothetical protein